MSQQLLEVSVCHHNGWYGGLGLWACAWALREVFKGCLGRCLVLYVPCALILVLVSSEMIRPLGVVKWQACLIEKETPDFCEEYINGRLTWNTQGHRTALEEYVCNFLIFVCSEGFLRCRTVCSLG